MAEIPQLKPFQGDDYFDLLGMGESLYPGVSDNLLAKTGSVTPEQMRSWRRIVQAIADRGLSANIHTQLRGTIEPFLAALEDINKVKSIKNLRWSFSHLDQVEPADLERMKQLGMAAQIHSRPRSRARCC